MCMVFSQFTIIFKFDNRVREANMYSNFKEQAIEYVKQAVQEDSAGNYAKAFPLLHERFRVFQDSSQVREGP